MKIGKQESICQGKSKKAKVKSIQTLEAPSGGLP